MSLLFRLAAGFSEKVLVPIAIVHSANLFLNFAYVLLYFDI